MSSKAYTVLLVLVLIESSISFYYPHEKNGKYCGSRLSRGLTECCTSRKDDCHERIDGTLCYCDEFCDRSHNGDCCPDYERVCKSPSLKPANITKGCKDGNLFVTVGKSFMRNCNKCTCTSSGRLECQNDKCLVDPDIIDHINQCNNTLGWTAKLYDRFFGKTIQDGLDMRLGALKPHKRVAGMSKISNPVNVTLPTCFYSVQEWTGLSGIRDQGWCGSSWAMASAQVASDRFAIKSKNQDNVDFATQQIIDCRKDRGCEGGHVDHAFNYLHKVGGVPEECYPYVRYTGECKVRKHDNLVSAGCSPSKTHRKGLYHMGPAYAIRANETDIMWEIYNHGPAVAIMKVYQDFFYYKDGIYHHSKLGDNHLYGYHAVRIIGWGEEKVGRLPMKFWVVANTWGHWWGNKGFFKIVRGVNECEIEDFVVGSLPLIKKKKH